MQLTGTPIFALLLTSLVSINGSPLPALINNEFSPSSLKTFNPQHSSHGAGSHGPLQIVTRTPDFKLQTPKNKNSTKKPDFNKNSNYTKKAGSKKMAINPTGRHNSTGKANLKSHFNQTSKAGSKKVDTRAAVRLPKLLEKIAKLFSRSVDEEENTLSTRAAVRLPAWLSKLAKFFRRDVEVESITTAKLNATRAHAHTHKNATKAVKFGDEYAGFGAKTGAGFNNFRNSKVVKFTQDVSEA